LRKDANWPADRVERWPVAKLVPNARNARTHSDEQVAQLAASIEEWGWTIPVLVDEAGGIIAGHGRVMAAHRLGIEDVPVMVAACWSDAKKRAYMLADNKLTLNAEWDLDRLAIEIAELRASDFDISLIGFSESEIDDLLKADADGAEPGAGSMAERFMIPPFSVLNARGAGSARPAAWCSTRSPAARSAASSHRSAGGAIPGLT
jgi:ParB-like chromosome segregation protein Spo0J